MNTSITVPIATKAEDQPWCGLGQNPLPTLQYWHVNMVFNRGCIVRHFRRGLQWWYKVTQSLTYNTDKSSDEWPDLLTCYTLLPLTIIQCTGTVLGPSWWHLRGERSPLTATTSKVTQFLFGTGFAETLNRSGHMLRTPSIHLVHAQSTFRYFGVLRHGVPYRSIRCPLW